MFSSSRTEDRDSPSPFSPDEAIGLDREIVIEKLRAAVPEPESIDRLLAGEKPSPARPIPYTRHYSQDSSWLRRANVVGINIRTIGSYFRVLAYALTLPASQNAVHLLPFWEPGVVASLYGISSWNTNPEFEDRELTKAFPALATAHSQLRFAVSVLHLMGKAVGLDVVPHTDRFSEIVLCNPSLFEWLKRDGPTLVDHRSSLREEAAAVIQTFVKEEGPAAPTNTLVHTPEENRCRQLFGPPEDPELRLRRRRALIDRLYTQGLETAPATMGPPYRGLAIDPDSATSDDEGHVWYDYRFLNPTPASRAFGPLTRYAFFESQDDNQEWKLDFSRPRQEAFDYLADHIGSLVDELGFDFMRGDMSHVQMRPGGPPQQIDSRYDPLGFVKQSVNQRHPGFAYFAESFLAPPGTISYGNEVDHLEAAAAETTLGDLQSTPVNSTRFSERLSRYLSIARTRSVTPCLTVMTGDKDDPRFDSFYINGNTLRLFLALFIPDMPSYMALGFELRDAHEEPAPNEHYTKLYVFKERHGPKATTGPYRFGSNRRLFSSLSRVRGIADRYLPLLSRSRTTWLLEPDPQAHTQVISWLVETDDEDRRPLICIVNLDTENSRQRVIVPLAQRRELKPVFSSNSESVTASLVAVPFPGVRRYILTEIGPGECLIYE
jgi:hypothetical protein